MKLSELNEYLQTLAGLGAIVALIAVGYEIRQSNRIATQQAVSETWIQWIEATASDLESGVSRITAKAILSPEALTLEDKMQLDSLLQKRIYVWSHDYFVLNLEADDAEAQGVLNDARTEAAQIFGSRFSRAWLRVNKYWIAPEVYTAIETGLEGSSISSELEYFERIDAVAATLE